MAAIQPALSAVPPSGEAELSLLAELAAYGDEPPQMPSGARGKSGLLRLRFERRRDRTVLADLHSRTPYLAQRALHCDEALPDMAWLFTITTTGCMLQGDRMTLEVALGPGARAHVTTQSATKIHAMEANHARQTQLITLDEGAYLEFLPDPLIPHRDSRFASDTRIALHPSATLLCSEIVQRGAGTIIPANASDSPCCRLRPRHRVRAGRRSFSKAPDRAGAPFAAAVRRDGQL